ncbi:MAG: cyclin-dependent kinase inhibitor 3 family protein [Vulcanimicrobiaceae bacterium]
MIEFKTSLTHPLIVDEVAVSGTAGRIDMTLFPGRRDDLNDNHWRRDLALDLEAIRRLDPSLLITLNEPHEFEILGVPDFEATLARSGLPWRHLPIPDGGVPRPDFERAWQHVGREAREALRAGGLIVIHCRAGLGRTGTIAARLLVELGTSPQSAIAAVRQARGPNMIETAAQVRHVLATRPIDRNRR